LSRENLIFPKKPGNSCSYPTFPCQYRKFLFSALTAAPFVGAIINRPSIVDTNAPPAGDQ